MSQDFFHPTDEGCTLLLHVRNQQPYCTTQQARRPQSQLVKNYAMWNFVWVRRKVLLLCWQSADTGWPPVQCRATLFTGRSVFFRVVVSLCNLLLSLSLTSMTQYRGILVQVTVHVVLLACQSSRAAPDRWPHCCVYFNPSLSLHLYYPDSQFVVFRFHGRHNLAWSVRCLRGRTCSHSSFPLLSLQKVGFGICALRLLTFWRQNYFF